MTNLWEDRWIENWKARLIEKKYPIPELITSKWGYQKALCPECGDEIMLRGYSIHITRRHRENNYKSRKGQKIGHYNVHERKVEPQEDRRPNTHWERDKEKDREWDERAKLSRANILKKYS